LPDAAGVTGDAWLLARSLYTDPMTQVKWNGSLSDIIVQQQGVRQGGILSTLFYKLYNQDLLDFLERGRVGYSIGTNHILGSPACADDVAILADTVRVLQSQARAAEYHAAKDRYNINASKTDVLVFNSKVTAEEWNESIHINLFDQPVSATETTVHLGVDRQATPKDQISKHIQRGRATAYSLMGSGLHGTNGVKPTVSIQM
jgi:hypothetical protein